MRKDVLYKKKGDVAEIWLNRPEKLNAITANMLKEIEEAMQKADLDDNVRVILLRGKGRAFSAGGDTGAPFSKGGEVIGQDIDPIAIYNRSLEDERVYERIRNLRKVTIAVIQGYCIGYGLQIASSCDLIIAEKGTKLGFPELKVGWAFTLASLSRTLGEKKAVELALLGDFIDSREALSLGIINRASPSEQLESVVTEVVNKVRARGPLLAWLTKTSIRRDLSTGIEKSSLLENLVGVVGRLTPEAQEAQKAFLEKRRPIFTSRFPKSHLSKGDS